MKLTKINTVLLIFGLILYFFQIIIATTSACSPNSVLCFGPRGVNFLGLNLNLGYIYTQFIITIVVLGITTLTTLMIHKTKPEITKEQLLNFGLTIFLILYLISSLLFFLFLSSIQY